METPQVIDGRGACLAEANKMANPFNIFFVLLLIIFNQK